VVATPDGKLLPSPPLKGKLNKQMDSSSSSGGGGGISFNALSDAEKEVATIVHEGMPECSKGLRVKPFAGGGALFYHKHGNGINDELSSHGGCPPNADDDPSWKVNGFMWNMDSETGPTLYS
jgi:hypothetical protein